MVKHLARARRVRTPIFVCLFLLISLVRPHDCWSEDGLPAIKIDNAILRLIDDTEVPALVSGTIKSMAVKEGTIVKQGQELASVDSKNVQLQIEAAKIELETAKRRAANDLDILEAEKSSAVAKAELDRVIAANAKTPNTFLAGEVDRYRLLYERAELGVQRAKYEQGLAKQECLQAANKIAVAEDLLGRHQTVAPCDGIVSKVERRVGEWVEPGQTMFQIVSIDRLRIDGLVPAEAADLNWIGKSVQLRLLTDSADQDGESMQNIPATVAFISPEVNPVDSTARILLEFENRELRLRPGKKVAVEMLLRTSEQQ